VKLASGMKLVLASHNPGKLREIRGLVEPLGVEAVSAAELGLAEPEETGTTFITNARLKSEAAARASGLPSLADDSGLAVDALGGAPGIYSARWAGSRKDFALAMRLVEEKLHAAGALDPEARRASFVCALSFSVPGAETKDFEGTVAGTLVWPPRGQKGFGYDPVFVPDGHAVTFGEMEPAAKHAMSHRAVAFRKFLTACT
jgi:XTP/dITP diphosphohydrolase